MDGLEAIGKALRDPRAQLVETLARQGRDLHRVREAIREPAPAQRVDRVDLVHHHLERQVVGTDVVQHSSDCRFLLVEALVRCGRVDDEQDEIGDEGLFERRREALHELGGQAADEADGVGHEIAPSVVFERARRRVERFEQPVVDGDVCVGQRVQQRRLADVRVAGQCDRRHLASADVPCGGRRAAC